MRPTFFIHILLFILCLSYASAFAGIKDYGLPFIVNHPRSAYNAGIQNWSITQSNKGFIYFGNNDGVLEYNGTDWMVYPVPNASVVRSVLAIGDTIYAGAFEQIGFLAPDDNGKLAWNSLNHLVPAEFKNFDEVWNIFHDGERVIFQSFSYIFVLDDIHVSVIKPEAQFGFMHEVNGKFYLVDSEKGLMRFQGDTLVQVSNHPVFFNHEITCILPKDSGSILIGTSNEGLFLWDGISMTPWHGPVSSALRRDGLFAGTMLYDGSFAFGSVSNGLYITDRAGDILQHLNRAKGLQNNTVLALYQDRGNNLWMGLDNGIDYTEISSPITRLDHNFNLESTYATIIHQDILYVGTNQGLFAAHGENTGKWNDNLSGFRLIEGTEGQVWSLEVIGNTLFCGHNFGAFQVDGFNARQISDIRGFWSFLPSPQGDDIIIAGTYTGLVRLEKRGENWHLLDEIKGFRESSRDLFLDHNNCLWVAHGYKGLFRLKLQDDFSLVREVHFYHGEAGLPFELPYNIQEINGKMFVSTHNGILKFDHHLEMFAPDPRLNAMFQGKGFIDKVHQDAAGNLWYFTHDSMGVMRLLEDGSFRDITSPFSRVNDLLLPAFQNIFIADLTNVFIGSQNGLMHYNPTIINNYQLTEQVSFTEISFYGRQHDRSFFTHSNAILENGDILPQLPHALNSVRFRFTVPVYENPDAVGFSYKLKGFDVSWSEWSPLNFKEYTNLREGDYVFMVKALNAFGEESEPASFHFTVAPPFLRSQTAYFIYAFLLAIIISGNVYYIRKRLMRIRQREKIRHEKRLARREQLFNEQTALSEKEIVHLRNESLKNEMQHKNKELANATLHLIQKNKTLRNLKDDLNGLLKNIPPDNPERYSVNVLLKQINKDLGNEKHWELFNNYFDEVHQDFIIRLKETYGDLSPKELRLCAYLRMNLSTKEIAPLMNISIRGVEISRYRLRKKLALDQNTNLSDFIISF